jgi:ABC-type Na+ efflux pump permease subunit
VASNRPRLTLARRELRSLTAEKTIVLALLIQLFIAGFSSFLVVGLVSLSDPGAIQGGAMTVGVVGNATPIVTAAIDEQPTVEARGFDTFVNASEEFHERDLVAVLEASHHENGTITVLATVPENSLRTTQIVAQVRSTLEIVERRQRQRQSHSLKSKLVPIPPEPPESSPFFGFTYTILVPLLLFLPVFISGSIAVDSVTEEIERETLELLRVAPVSLRQIVEGKLLAAVGIAPIQALLWIGLLGLNGTSVQHVPLLTVLVAALTTILVCLGVGLAVTIGERRQAQLLYSLVMLTALTAAVFLPEHPANTIARLAIGSPGPETFLATAGYVAVAVAALIGIAIVTTRIDPDTV